jgi:hypothetical protein
MVPSFSIRVKQCPEEALAHILLNVHHINRMMDIYVFPIRYLLKNQQLLSHVIFFNILASHFPLTKDNMDILNYFIDFMTYEMQWGRLFSVLSLN